MLIPFCAVGLFYTAVQLWVDARIGRPGLPERRSRWQQGAIWLRINPLTSFLLKMPKWLDLAAVVILTLLSISLPGLIHAAGW